MIKHIVNKYKRPRWDPDEFIAYKIALPRSILVDVSKDPTGYYVVDIKKIDGQAPGAVLVTQAKKLSDISYQITDLLCVYKNVPEQYRSLIRFVPQDAIEHKAAQKITPKLLNHSLKLAQA